MKKDSITKKIATYINENQISMKQTALDLRIPEEKLRYGNEESLTAEEFLRVCQYLGIRPESLG